MQSRTALELFKETQLRKPCPLLCPILNNVLGGIPSTGVTEIAGEAGSGKTQFCLSTSLTCAFNGIQTDSNWNVAYICCGEGNFPLKRFLQLSENLVSDPLIREKVLRNIHIETCHTTDDACHAVDVLIPNMCQRGINIRLVIVDSIAGLVRTEFDTRTAKDMSLRTNMLFKFASKLKWLSDTYTLGVIVVNQVTATGFEDGAKNLTITSSHTTGRNGWAPVTPALGLAWSHCVNTRILLERSTSSFQAQMSSLSGPLSTQSSIGQTACTTDSSLCDKLVSDGVDKENYHQQPAIIGTRSRRRLSVVFSSYLPSQGCDFVITSSGLYGYVL